MENEIILGDAYELIKTLPDKSVDLIVTDPPYEYEHLDGGGIGGKRQFFKEIKHAKIDKGFNLSLIDEMMRVLKNPNLYIWVSKSQFRKVLNYACDKYGCKWDLIVWAKQNPTPLCNNQYLHDAEYCLWLHSGVPFKGNYETAKTVYLTPVNQADKKLYGHPTIKPEEIIENLILNSSGGG